MAYAALPRQKEVMTNIFKIHFLTWIYSKQQYLPVQYDLYTNKIGQLRKYHGKRKQWPNNLPNFDDFMQN